MALAPRRAHREEKPKHRLLQRRPAGRVEEASPKPSSSASTRSGRRRRTAPTRSHRSPGGARRRLTCGWGPRSRSCPAAPAAAAMAAMTLDHLSGGRFILGLGGPARRSSMSGTACHTRSRRRAPASTPRSTRYHRAGRPGHERRPALSAPLSEGHRPRQAAAPTSTPRRRHPDLPRRRGAEERGARGQDPRRWMPLLSCRATTTSSGRAFPGASLPTAPGAHGTPSRRRPRSRRRGRRRRGGRAALKPMFAP